MRARITVFLVVFVAVAGFYLGQTRGKAVARPQAASVGGCTIPKSWGTLKAGLGFGLIFEDSAGTLRAIGLGECLKGRGEAEVEIHRK